MWGDPTRAVTVEDQAGPKLRHGLWAELFEHLQLRPAKSFSPVGAARELTVELLHDGEADKNKTKRRDALSALGVHDELEQDAYIEYDDLLIDAKFAVLGSNFEEALRAKFPAYMDVEETGRESASIPAVPCPVCGREHQRRQCGRRSLIGFASYFRKRGRDR